MRISILDFGIRDSHLNSLMKINSLINYAQEAEELGYHRIWLTEHYFSSLNCAWTNPIPIIPILCQYTKKIRVGTGGIMLKLHDVLDIATQFKFYNSVYKNRIDLGIVNGKYYNEYITKLSEKNTDFDEMFREIVNMYKNENFYLENGIILPPFGGKPPQLWAMSSSNNGTKRAFELGTNFARSIFHVGADLSPKREILEAFKHNFFDKYGVFPMTALAVSVCCKKNEVEAKRYFLQKDLTKDYHIIGSVEYCSDKILEYYEAFGVDEIMIRDIITNPEERIETLNLLSETLKTNYVL